MSEDYLSGKEHFDLVVEQGLSSIPGIGHIAEHYYMVQDEKRFKRLEKYFQELKEEVSKREIINMEKSEEWLDQLTHLIEKILNTVESESIEEKRAMFVYYTATLFSNTISYQELITESELILETLIKLSYVDLILLEFLFSHSEEEVLVGSITFEGLDNYGILGIVSNLKNCGLLKAVPHSISLGRGVDNNLNEIISISSFGEKFVNYCLMKSA